MTVWTWAALGLIVAGWLVPWLLDRRQSRYARDAAVVGNVVLRMALSGIFVWVIARLIGRDDLLHILLAVPVGLVLMWSLFTAGLGIVIFFSRSSG